MPTALEEKRAALRKFILGTIGDTLKQADGFLKHPYISPGGPYAVQLWDWDSYWTIYAILNLARQTGDAALLEKARPHARGTLLNFLDQQGEDGAIPICMAPNCADIFDCRSSADFNMAKPFLGQMAWMLHENRVMTDDELRTCLPKLKKYHDCAIKRYQDSRTGLFFWAHDWAIGVDDDPAAWGRPAKSAATLYQNVFLYQDMLDASKLAKALGDEVCEMEYADHCHALKTALQKYCWDQREKSFFSVDLQCNANRTKNAVGWTLNIGLDAFWFCLPLKVLTWNSILPFWAGLGTQEQFDAFVRENLVPGRLWSNHGIRSLSQDEPMYRPEEKRGNPSNWLGPIWLIANYITWQALLRYERSDLADQLAANLIDMLYNDLQTNGKFHEYYSPESGLGVHNPGFMSWNALAALL